MDTLVVINGIWMDTNTFVLPMEQVLRSCMIPVLEPMHSPPRAPLVIKMPDSLMVNEAIWIAG